MFTMKRNLLVLLFGNQIKIPGFLLPPSASSHTPSPVTGMPCKSCPSTNQRPWLVVRWWREFAMQSLRKANSGCFAIHWSIKSTQHGMVQERIVWTSEITWSLNCWTWSELDSLWMVRHFIQWVRTELKSDSIKSTSRDIIRPQPTTPPPPHPHHPRVAVLLLLRGDKM